MIPGRPVKLFKDGCDRALRIPLDLKFPGEEAIVRRRATGSLSSPLPLSRCSRLAAARPSSAESSGSKIVEDHRPTGGTPPGAYTITVTSTSGSAQHSTTVTLTVQ